MGSKTQDNWNNYFGNKKSSSFRNKNIFGFIIILLILGTMAFYSRDNIIQVIKHGFGSSYNGIAMQRMASRTMDIIEENNDYLEEFIDLYNTYQLSTTNDNSDFIDQWSTFLTNSMVYLQETDFHQSYTSYIDAVKFTLYSTRELIEDYKNEKLGYKSINTAIDKINQQSQLVIDELLKAFDKNLIEYTIIEDGSIIFKYRIK